MAEFDAARRFTQAALVVGVELFVEAGQPAGQRGNAVGIGGAHQDAHRQILERHAGLGDERLAGGFQRFGDADGVDDDVVGLGGLGAGRDFFEVVHVQRAGAAAFHLLEVVAAFDVAHEEQAFERLDVGAGGDHVDGDGDARVVFVAELGEDGFGVFALLHAAVGQFFVLGGAVGDFLAEGVAFTEFLAHGLDDVVGVAVGLGEDQRLGHFFAAGEDGRQVVAEGADDGADLVRVDDVAVELGGGVGGVFVLLFPALFAGQAFALFNLLFGGDDGALLGDAGVDQVNLVADVHPVGDGFFMAVVADDILFEEAVGAVVGRGGEADQAGVEIVEHLLPEVVDAAVAFVDEDEVEEFGRDFGVVGDGGGCLGLDQFSRVDFFGGFVELLVLQQRVKALDGRDADVGALVDEAVLEPLHRVKLGEFAVIVDGHVGHHFLLGLLAEVFGIDEEKHAPGVGVLEQAVNAGDGGVGLAGAGGHLNEGARPGFAEGLFEVGDRRFLAIAQAEFFGGLVFGVERRQFGKAGTQAFTLGQPVAQGFRAVEAEDFTRARLGVAGVGKTGDDAGGFVEEGQRLPVVQPLELGGGVAFGLRFVGGQMLALFLALGFDDADGLAVDEKHVVGGADIGVVFAHRLAGAAAEVDFAGRLHDPARLPEQRVDVVAGFLFGVLVVAHEPPLSANARS